MSAKIFFVFCAQALFVQSVLSQCASRFAAGPGIAAPALITPYGLGASYGLAAPALGVPTLAAPYGIVSPDLAAPGLDYTPTSGGLLPISSGSIVAPLGISVASENRYEGPLAVAGELPFVGTVGLEGVLPTAGVGVVNHACGNGINAMVSEPAAYAPTYAGAIAPAGALAPYGLGAPGVVAPALAASGLAAPALAAPALAAPFGLAVPALTTSVLEYTPTSGGLLPISSGSAIAPVGISVASENIYEGPLNVAGELPFVGTVGLEGVLPTVGAGVVNHSCGNGINAMVSENAAFAPAYAGINAAGLSPFGAIAPGISAPALGYGAGWAGRGCGYAL